MSGEGLGWSSEEEEEKLGREESNDDEGDLCLADVYFDDAGPRRRSPEAPRGELFVWSLVETVGDHRRRKKAGHIATSAQHIRATNAQG